MKAHTFTTVCCTMYRCQLLANNSNQFTTDNDKCWTKTMHSITQNNDIYSTFITSGQHKKTQQEKVMLSMYE